MSESIENIINYFGGIRPMGRTINCPATTISSWKRRSRIPQAHWRNIIQEAKKIGLNITSEQLSEAHPPLEK